MTHVLLRCSHRFPVMGEPAVEGWRYSRADGLWVRDGVATGSSDKKPKPVSKKADVETGEDMKGA